MFALLALPELSHSNRQGSDLSNNLRSLALRHHTASVFWDKWPHFISTHFFSLYCLNFSIVNKLYFLAGSSHNANNSAVGKSSRTTDPAQTTTNTKVLATLSEFVQNCHGDDSTSCQRLFYKVRKGRQVLSRRIVVLLWGYIRLIVLCKQCLKAFWEGLTTSGAKIALMTVGHQAMFMSFSVTTQRAVRRINSSWRLLFHYIFPQILTHHQIFDIGS